MSNKKSGIGGLVFVGCILLGTGIGMLVDNTSAGVMIGIGAGFLVLALFGSR